MQSRDSRGRNRAEGVFRKRLTKWEEGRENRIGEGGVTRGEVMTAKTRIKGEK
jgi:hypothetical protein